MAELALSEPQDLPIGPIGRHGVGLWGVATIVATEAALFGYLLFAYFYTGATAPTGWLLDPTPDLHRALPNTVLLLASSVVAWIGERGIRNGRRAQTLLAFGLAFIMGTVFVIVQWLEWRAKTYGIGASSYASLYFLTTGFHVLHVIVGLLMFAAVFVWSGLGYFSRRRELTVTAAVWYWHFVNLVGILVFGTFYLTPYLGFGR